MSETNTTYLPAVRVALPVTTMEELATAGAMLAQSGMFGVTNAAAGFVVAATCHQQGISLMEFRRTYHMVDGTPSMRADAMLAELRKRGGRHKIVENSTTRAAVEIEYDGQVVTFAYTMDDAERTGDCFKGDGRTLKHNWIKRPDDMLWARCVSRAVRRLCPEIVAGLYTPEEVEDFTPAANPAPATITPEEAVRRAKPVTPVATVETTDDATRCPALGSDLDGRAWSEMDVETLRGALAYEGAELRPAHKAAIRLELAEREKAEKVYAIGTPDQSGGVGMWWGPNPDFDAAFAHNASDGDELFEMVRPTESVTRMWVMKNNTWVEKKGKRS